MGHTPKSSSSVSTGVSRLIEAVDAVVLVDNATQPMQAAPLAAMRELVATGNGRKLILAFTHFDEVKGDNLPSTNEKAQHVSGLGGKRLWPPSAKTSGRTQSGSCESVWKPPGSS